MNAAFVGTPVAPFGGLVRMLAPVVKLLVRPVVKVLWKVPVI
jgi:hypothetical protein